MTASGKTTSQAQRSAPRALILGTSGVVLGGLPGFLTGALAVQLTADLGFGVAGIGLAIAIYRGTSAVAAVPLGRLTDRFGSTFALRVAAMTGAMASLGIATTADSWLTLAAWLMLGGCGLALVHPAANRLLMVTVPANRLGIAFGIKQAAPPVGSMLAGLSVPLIAITIGWRWAFVLVAGLSALLGLAARRPRHGQGRVRASGMRQGRLRNRHVIVLLSASFGLATGASSTISAFFVVSAQASGLSIGVAGSVLAVASAAAVLARILAGAAADRMTGGHLVLCGGMLAAGSLGFLLLALGHPISMTVGVVIASAGAWGFNGVFWYSLVIAYPESPGSITGAVSPGALTGGSVGPLLVGWVAEAHGFTLAWEVAGACALVAAGLLLANARALQEGRTTKR